jgi:hypothetical protein
MLVSGSKEASNERDFRILTPPMTGDNDSRVPFDPQVSLGFEIALLTVNMAIS